MENPRAVIPGYDNGPFVYNEGDEISFTAEGQKFKGVIVRRDYVLNGKQYAVQVKRRKTPIHVWEHAVVNGTDSNIRLIPRIIK